MINCLYCLIISSNVKEKGLMFVIDCRRSSQAQIIKTVIEKIAVSKFFISCSFYWYLLV